MPKAIPSTSPHSPEDLDRMARALEQSADYKVLRRLIPRAASEPPEGQIGRLGIILDMETTGLDRNRHEVIELAMIKFRYSDRDEVTGVSDIFQAFNAPSSPIPAEITELTGITDKMVAGHKIDAAAVEDFIADADIVIAHNAKFDRPFAESAWPIFVQKHWACSLTEVDWKSYGFDGGKLGYLLAGCGLFHGAHRAIDDCHALLEVLSQPVGGMSGCALAALLARARRNTKRIWAERSPYDLKDKLKARGYRWNDGTDRRPKGWYIDVDEARCDAELRWLKTDIYQRDVDLACRKITALDRFSGRIGTP